MTREQLRTNTFVGVIEDNNDPNRLGRCKVRVLDVFNEIPAEDIPWAKPWKDLSGNVFSIPEKGKVVTVVFDNGSIYKPEYIYSEHYNVNLEKKLQELKDSDYPSFKSVLFDQSTQIFRTKSEGLVLDHEYSNINLDESGNINVNLRNNGAFLKLGTPDASQQAILGNHFMEWMDKLVDTLGATPYIGNLMVPVIPSPTLIPVLAEYRLGRATSKYLSKNVFIVDNGAVNTQQRDYQNQDGDKWKSTVKDNKVTTTRPSTPNKEPNQPETPAQTPPTVPNSNPPVEQPQQNPDNNYTGKTFLPSAEPPSRWNGALRNEASKKPLKIQVISNFKNGKIDYKKRLKLSNRIKSDLPKGCSDEYPEHCWYLWPEACDELEKMMTAYDAANFPGKKKIVIGDGYRSYERQVNLFKQKVKADGSGENQAGRAGTSPHGWGFAIDLYWGVDINSVTDESIKAAAFKHPVYQWLHNNSHKYGWYNPEILRDGAGEQEEWWHFEYMPQRKKRKPGKLIDAYKPPFTQKDFDLLFANPSTNVAYMQNVPKPISLT